MEEHADIGQRWKPEEQQLEVWWMKRELMGSVKKDSKGSLGWSNQKT